MSRELTAHDMQGKPQGKPEQAKPVPRFWCDDAFGCKKQKSLYDFSIQRKELRSHPDLCDDCIRGMITTFGIQPAQFGMLHLVRCQERNFITQAKYQITDRDISGPLAILKVGEPGRFRQYLGKLGEVSKRYEIEAVRTAYVTWWWKQLQVDYKPIQGGIQMVSGAAVPVGDR